MNQAPRGAATHRTPRPFPRLRWSQARGRGRNNPLIEGFLGQEDLMKTRKRDEVDPALLPAKPPPEARSDDQRLEEGLEETFPASDPVSAKDIE